MRAWVVVASRVPSWCVCLATAPPDAVTSGIETVVAASHHDRGGQPPGHSSDDFPSLAYATHRIHSEPCPSVSTIARSRSRSPRASDLHAKQPPSANAHQRPPLYPVEPVLPSTPANTKNAWPAASTPSAEEPAPDRVALGYKIAPPSQSESGSMTLTTIAFELWPGTCMLRGAWLGDDRTTGH